MANTCVTTLQSDINFRAGDWTDPKDDVVAGTLEVLIDT